MTDIQEDIPGEGRLFHHQSKFDGEDHIGAILKTIAVPSQVLIRPTISTGDRTEVLISICEKVSIVMAGRSEEIEQHIRRTCEEGLFIGGMMDVERNETPDDARIVRHLQLQGTQQKLNHRLGCLLAYREAAKEFVVDVEYTIAICQVILGLQHKLSANPSEHKELVGRVIEEGIPRIDFEWKAIQKVWDYCLKIGGEVMQRYQDRFMFKLNAITESGEQIVVDRILDEINDLFSLGDSESE